MRLSLLFPLVLILGCGGNQPGDTGRSVGDPAPGPKETLRMPSAEGKAYMLAAEPSGAKGVIDIRKDAKNDDEVVVVGRVGGTAKPFTEGRGAFLIVDTTLKPTAECDTPWDFCEYPKKEVAAARLVVRFVDGAGKTVEGGARELFGIKELSTVVVKGKVRRDDKENVVVVASGLFVRPE